MLTRYFLILLTFIGFAAPVASFAQDADKPAEAVAEPEAPKVEAPQEAPKTAPAEPEKPVAPTPPPPPPPPIKIEPPKAIEMPKMEPPKIDPELAAATDRWVNLSDQQRLDILEEWKKLPEENRIPFMIYRDDATKKVRPEAKAEAVDAKDIKAVAAPDISVPAAPAADAPAEEEGGVSKLIDKIF